MEFDLKKTIYFVIFTVLILIIEYNIIVPSYYSYVLGCKVPEEVAISLSSAYYNPKTGEIFIEEQVDDKIRRREFRHEWTHHLQFLQGRKYGCDKPVGYFMNEIEANINEFIPLHEFPYFKLDFGYNINSS